MRDTVGAGTGRGPRLRWGRTARAVALAASTFALLASCTAPSGAPPTTSSFPVAPSIGSFIAVTRRTEAPVAAVLAWTVSDANGDDLTCRIDTEGDGVTDRTVRHCDSGDSILVSSSVAGTWHPVLEVDDGTSEPALASSTFTVTEGPAEDFTITLNLAPTMQPEYRAAFQGAADRWAGVVRAGLSDQQLTVPQDFLGWMPAFDGMVDDLLIVARDIEMDGPRGTLGHAGALLTREFGGQAYFGVMEFDTADLERLAASGRLGQVILHEMGHVLGIGANWALEGLVDDPLTNPSYNGAAGMAAWHELGGTGRVPLETTGGSGTAIGHWRESTFDTELMTGYSDPAEALSRLTVAALVDRGYGVDLGAADPYALPVPSAGLRVDAASDPGDHLHTDPMVPYPAGRLPGA